MLERMVRMEARIEHHLQNVRSCTSRDLASKESIRGGGMLQVTRAESERHHSAGEWPERSDYDRIVHRGSIA